MTHVVPRVRIENVRIRGAMLLLVIAGNLPIPVIHAHDVANGTRQLAVHVALFHSGRCSCDAHRLHVHMIPPSFFGGSAGGATGDDVPAPELDKACPPQVAQLDAPLTLDVGVQAVNSTVGRPVECAVSPRHFLETYQSASDIGGLWGVCRC